VTTNIHRPEKDEIAREILAYLRDHPDAEDTLDGIVQWWILDRKIKYQKALVQKAIDDLTKSNLIIEQKKKNIGCFYRINRSKSREITTVLKEQNSRMNDERVVLDDR
jgi:hypothetical protein